MATAASVIQKLQNLIRIAENTTGQSHPDLHSAIKALVKGYGDGSSVTIHEGQYTVADSGGQPVILKLVHNFGELKPFCFFLSPKGTKFPTSSGESVYQVQLYVPTVSPQGTDISYGPGNQPATIYSNPMLSLSCMDGSNFECAYNPLTVSGTDPGGTGKLSVSMWPNGFYLGLPRELDPGITYNYTLVWGV